MKIIKCNHCGKKWYVEDFDIPEMQVCLFCGAALCKRKEISDLDSLDKVIYKAVTSLGDNAFAHPAQLSGYMMDIAPGFRKELRILSRAFNDEYFVLVKDAFSKDIQESDVILSKLRTLLVEDDGLSETWADLIYKSFSWQFATLMVLGSRIHFLQPLSITPLPR